MDIKREHNPMMNKSSRVMPYFLIICKDYMFAVNTIKYSTDGIDNRPTINILTIH